MKTKLTEMFGIDLPVFAFSHCRDVVVEVSRAGGLGVLGCAYQTPEQLRQELRWIDDHVDGKPYGIDLLMPGNYQQLDTPRVTLDSLPQEQTNYLSRWCDEAGVGCTTETGRKFGKSSACAEVRELHWTVIEHRSFRGSMGTAFTIPSAPRRICVTSGQQVRNLSSADSRAGRLPWSATPPQPDLKMARNESVEESAC